MATIAKLDVLLGLKGDGFGQGLDAARGKLNSWGESLRSTGTKLTAGVTTPLALMSWQALQASSSLDQAQGKVDAVFGDSAAIVKDWSKTTTNAFGISQTAALQSAGTMGNFFTSAGLALDQSAQYSTQLVELSGDMAAFNDVSSARASEAIISGMAGEYDSLQRLGVNITAAKVETEALAIATADGRTEITEADLALARYNVIMEESKNQHGQAAREYDNFSSKLARMQARLSDLAARWGDKLMPVALDFLDVVEDLLGWVERLSPSMQRWAIIIAAVAAAAGPLLIALGMMLPGLSLLLGLVGALLSPLGLLVAAAALLAWAFRDELGAALDWIVEAITDAVDWFQKFRHMGLDPAQAALMALAATFPILGTVIAPLRQLVENLGDAFQALKDGDYGAMFDSLGAAARNVGSAIKAAIDLIDWGGIASALWDGIQTAAVWVGSQILEIPSIAVSIGKWAVGKIDDVWEWLKRTIVGGTGKSDGTGGATYGGRNVDLGEVLASVSSWAEGAIKDVWAWLRAHVLNKKNAIALGAVTADVASWTQGEIGDLFGQLKKWVMGETGGVLSLPNIAASVTSWVAGVIDPVADDITKWVGDVQATISAAGNVSAWSSILVPESGTTIANIRDAVGDLTVDGIVALLDIDLNLQTVNNITDTIDKVQARIENFLIQAIKVTAKVAFALVMAPLAGLGTLLAAAGLNISAYLAGNPMEAKRLAVAFSAWFDRNKSTIWFTYAELAAWAIEKVVPGGSLVLKIPTLIELIWSGGDEGPTATGQDLSQFPVPGETGPGVPEGWLLDLPKITVTTDAIEGPPIPDSFRSDFGLRLTDAMQPPATTAIGAVGATIGTQVAAWMPIFSTGLQPLGPIATVSFGAVNASAATQLGMASASVAANTGTMSATSTANLGTMAANGAGQIASMAASVTAGLSGMRGSAVSTVSSMGSSVGSSITSMSTTSAAQVLGMRMGIVASMATMQSSAVSNANSMRSGVVSAFTSMALQSASAVRSGLGAIPGIVSSVGGSAAAAAYGVGANISSSMAAGMYSALGAIQAAANAMVAAASTALRARAMIASPSKLFRQLGGYVGEGFAQGIEGTSDRVARATADLVSIPDVRGVMASVGASGDDGSAGGRGEVRQYFFALTSDEFRALLAKAERGSAFAEGFADELGMREGQG